MKRTLLNVAGAILLVACFAACKSLPTLQQQFTQACPIVTADLETLSTSPLIGSSDQDALAKAAKANKAFCAAGGQLNVTDLKAFHDSLLPAAVAVVNGNPLIPNQTEILLVLNTFGPIMQQMVDQLITAVTAPASSPAPASTPAVAPDPASSVVA